MLDDDYSDVIAAATATPPKPRKMVRGMEKLKGVQPDLINHWNNLQTEFDKAGVVPTIKSGYRTAKQQNDLHVKGYPTKGNDGYINISPHQDGRSLDLGFNSAQKQKGREIIANYARANNLHVPDDEPWHIAIPKQKVGQSDDDYADVVKAAMGQSDAPDSYDDVIAAAIPAQVGASATARMPKRARPRDVTNQVMDVTAQAARLTAQPTKSLLPVNPSKIEVRPKPFNFATQTDEQVKASIKVELAKEIAKSTPQGRAPNVVDRELDALVDEQFQRLKQEQQAGVDYGRQGGTPSMGRREPGRVERIATAATDYSPGLRSIDTPMGIKTDLPRGVARGLTLGAVGDSREITSDERLMNPNAETERNFAEGVGETASAFVPYVGAGKLASMVPALNKAGRAVAAKRVGATFGGVETAREGIRVAKTGEPIDPTEIAVSTAIGAVMGAIPGLNAGLKQRIFAAVAPQVAADVARGRTLEESAQSALTNVLFEAAAGRKLGLSRGRIAELRKQIESRQTVPAELQEKLSRGEVNVPEKPSAMQAQLDARGYTLIPDGTPKPSLPRGTRAITTADGTVYYNPTRIDAATIRNTPTSELLGHVEPKSETTTETVVARAADGTEVQSSAVSPENVAKQAEVMQEQLPETQIEVGGPEKAAEVIAERTAPQRFQHLQFGEVEVVADQSGAATGRVKVAEVADPNKIHYVKKADLQGRGNARMIPLKAEPAEPAATASADEAALREQPTASTPKAELERRAAEMVDEGGIESPEQIAQRNAELDAEHKLVTPETRAARDAELDANLTAAERAAGIKPTPLDRLEGGETLLIAPHRRTQQGKQQQRISIEKDGKEVGNLIFDDSRAISVFVDDAYRRQGFASKMYDAAAKVNGKPLAQGARQTSEGQAFRTSYDVPKAESPSVREGEKPPWEKTGGEWLHEQGGEKGDPRRNSSTITNAILETHRKYVEQALREGKPVPSKVLDGYPDLQPSPQGKVPKPIESPTGQNKNLGEVGKELSTPPVELERQSTGLPPLRPHEVPDVPWVRRTLDAIGRPFYRGKVLDTFVVGSHARGTAKEGSDLDVAVIIPKNSRRSAMQISEDFHSHYKTEAYKPTFEGRKVDFQFFFPDDPTLATYSKLRKAGLEQPSTSDVLTSPEGGTSARPETKSSLSPTGREVIQPSKPAEKGVSNEATAIASEARESTTNPPEGVGGETVQPAPSTTDIALDDPRVVAIVENTNAVQFAKRQVAKAEAELAERQRITDDVQKAHDETAANSGYSHLLNGRKYELKKAQALLKSAQAELQKKQELLESERKRKAPLARMEARKTAESVSSVAEVAPITSEPSTYGSTNKLITADRAAAARARLKAKLDPSKLHDITDIASALPDLAELGAFHIEAGTRRFGAWSKQFLNEFNEDDQKKIKPHLEDIFDRASGLINRDTTSARKAQMAQDRADLDLPDLPAAERIAWQTTLDTAREQGLSRRAMPIAHSVLKTPRILEDAETAGLVLKAQEIKNDYAKIVEEAGAETDPRKLQDLRSEAEMLQGDFDVLSDALKQSGSAKGRALAIQKLTINQDFDQVSMRNRFKAKTGKAPSEKIVATIEKQAATIKELDAKLAEHEQRVLNDQVSQAADRIRREVARETRQARRGATIAAKKGDLDAEAAELTKLIAIAWKKVGRPNVHGMAAVDPEGELVKLVLKLARNRVKKGVVSGQGLVNEVHGLLEDVAEIDRRRVAEIISGYGRKGKPRTDLEKQLDALKSELYQGLSAEDVAAGKRAPRREGPSMREMVGKAEGPRLSDVRKVKAEGPRLSDANKLKAEGPKLTDAPKLGPKNTWPARKVAIEKQIAELERKIREQDYSKAPKRGATVLDAEGQKLRDKLQAVKNDYDILVERNSPWHWLKNLSGIRKSGMLSGYVTHVRNIVGTGAHIGFEEARRVPSVVADAAISVVTGRRTVTLSPSAMLDGVIQAATVGRKEATEIIRHGAPRDQTDRQQYREIHTGVQAVDAAFNAVFRFMSASDRVFYQGAYKRNLTERAQAQAKTESRIDKSLNYRERVKELQADEQLQADAKHDALRSTFNNNNRLSDAITKARSGLGAGGNFALDLVLPFDRTPTNVIARVIEASPAGFGKNAIQLSKALWNKEFSAAQQRAFVETFGRATTGTAVSALGFALAVKGLLTTDDYGVSHLNINGRKINLSSIAPVGTLLGIGASLYKQWSKKGDKRNYAGAVLKPLVDQPLLRATSQVTDFVKDPQRGAGKLGANLATSFIPFSGAVRTAGEGLDPADKRYADPSFTEQFKRSIPKLRESLPASRVRLLGSDVTKATKEADRLEIKIKGAVKQEDETAEEFEKRKTVINQKIKDQIEAVVDSPDYDKKSDEDKTKWLKQAAEFATKQAKESLPEKPEKKEEAEFPMPQPKGVGFDSAYPADALSRYERMSAAQRTAVRGSMTRKAKVLLSDPRLSDEQKAEFKKRLDALGIAPSRPRRSMREQFASP